MPVAKNGKKICSTCKINKDLICFGIKTRNKDGLDYQCKECLKKYSDNHDKEKKERGKKLRAIKKEKNEENFKLWVLKNPIIVVDIFIKLLYKHEAQREKNNINGRIRYRKDSTVKNRSRDWARNNPEKVKFKNKRWQKNNPEKYREVHRNNVNKLRKTDPLYKIKSNLRRRIREAIKGNKTESTKKLIGEEWQFVVGHLQYTANLYNYLDYTPFNKKYQIDHIIPVDAFTNLSDPIQIKLCSNWRNLQILLAKENGTANKSNKRIKNIPERFLPYLKQSYIDGKIWIGVNDIDINSEFYKD